MSQRGLHKLDQDPDQPEPLPVRDNSHSLPEPRRTLDSTQTTLHGGHAWSLSLYSKERSWSSQAWVSGSGYELCG